MCALILSHGGGIIRSVPFLSSIATVDDHLSEGVPSTLGFNGNSLSNLQLNPRCSSKEL